MAKQAVVNEKSDSIDIISVGKLYQGPWEKKYWSSSRGKDRYPYPVGYGAVRTNNGCTYKMEIFEGPKGPEFLISSTDGHSYSGQTPDIAWEGFQKKFCLRIKLWRGKKFSCKIDGAELFGFKNPTVQRLLRGLKADVSETTEQRFPSSCLGNGLSEETPQLNSQCTVHANLFTAKDKGKRSRKHKEISVKSVSGAKCKRGRPEDQTQKGDLRYSRQSHEGNHIMGISTSSASNENNTDLDTTVEGGKNSLAADRLQFDCSISSDHFGKEKPLAAQDANNSMGCKDIIAVEGGINMVKDAENLDGSMYTYTPGFSFSKPAEEKRVTTVPKDSQMLDIVGPYAPDTLDEALDSTCNIETEIPKERTCNMNNELNVVAAPILDSEECNTESCSKVEMYIPATSEQPEKTDSDPFGQEIAKSMMTVLLPRALPLLNTFSRKKKTSPNCRKGSLHGMSQEEETGTNQSLEDGPPAKDSSEQFQLEKLKGEVGIGDKPLTENYTYEKQNEKVSCPSTDMGLPVLGLENSTPVVPDSFENDHCELMEYSGATHLQDAIEADQNSSGINLCTNEGHHVYPNIEQSKEVCHIGTTTSKTNFSRDAHLVLEKNPQTGDTVVTDYNLDIRSLRTDLCVHSDESTQLCEKYLEQKDVKFLPHTEGMESTVDGKSTITEGIDHVAKKETKDATGGVHAGNVSAPHSEGILCRDFRGDLAAKTCSVTTDVPASVFLIDQMRPVKKPHSYHIESNSTSCDTATVASHEDYVCTPNHEFPSGMPRISVNCRREPILEHQDHYRADGSISSLQDRRVSCHDMTEKKETKDKSCLNKLTEMARNDEMENIFELVGCYVHPTPISLVMLRTIGNELFICVLCGYLMEKDRTLFIYKASINGETRGSPSLVGRTTMISPVSRNETGGQVSLDGSSLQFTPDGKCIVLLNSIKAPYCREGNVNCQCLVCTSDCFEKNAVKIVQVKLGYVQVLSKLKTTNNVCCILVCEPSYLVAAEESGRMHLWTMNSTWSAQTEESYLPTSDCMPNYIIEMKRIPKFPVLIVGHNAFGDFCLWDIYRRSLVSKFSAPRTSFRHFLPISLFRCPSQGVVATSACRKQQVIEIMRETQMWSSEKGNHDSLLVNEEDVCLVLLVLSVSNLDLHNRFQYKDSGVGWSLALLAKNKLILENALDPSATVVGVSAGYGIMATCDGSLHIWELSTGTKLGYLTQCRGATVSCLATDDSGSGAFAVAVDGSQLQVYAPGTSANKKHN